MTSGSDKVDGARETERFARVTFDRYRDLARDPSLSESEKMGAARGHREGYDDAIWRSLLERLPPLAGRGLRILDVGAGCGGIARRFIALAEQNGHHISMMDHQEMLDQLPASPAVERIAGRFPDDMPRDGREAYDVVVIYSVLHSVVLDANPFFFLDAALAQLKPGGWLLIGDVPNFSKLRRFLASEAGAAFHREYMRTDQDPAVPPFAIAEDRLDDGMIIGLVMRARLAGYDAYLLPQLPDLPFSNRREDLLIRRP